MDARWVSWSAEDPQTTVEVAPDLRLPKYLEAFVVGEPDIEVDLRISAVLDESLGRYVTDVLELRRRSSGDDITGAVLRSVRVQDYLRRAVRDALRDGQVSAGSALFDVEFELRPDDAAKVRALGPSSPEAMRWTARIYRFAAAVNERPAKAVQEQLGLTVPNASVWIRRARDTGVLVDPQRPSGGDDSRRAFERARRVGDMGGWPD